MEATPQQQAPQRSLIKKLSEVMALVGRVPKNGENTFHNYKYAMEADIVEAVRSELASRHLVLVPDVEEVTWSKVSRSKGGEDRIATLKVKFTLMDGDSGETLVFHALGEGQDPGDKATYKAMTGALKYALLKLLMIPTGDDPEKDSPKSADSGAPSAPRQERPASGGSEVVKFGRDKGKPLAEVDAAGLAWLEAKAAEDVAKNDPKWHTKNLAWQSAVKAELKRREKPATPSQEPAAPVPKGTPFECAVAQLDAQGVPYKAYSEKLKEWGVARPKDVTDAIAAKLVAFFSGDAPPFSDADAPPAGGAQ